MLMTVVKNRISVAILACSLLSVPFSVNALNMGAPLLGLSYSETMHYQFPASYHALVNFTQYGVVQLEDGSEWSVQASEAHITTSWRQGDILVLTPCSSYSKTYYLTNKTLKSYVTVVSYKTPFADSPYTFRVTSIDYLLSQICVQNGLGEVYCMRISSLDRHYLNKWFIGDAILIGSNDSWFSWGTSFDSILYNYNLNQHVRTKQI